MGAPAGFAKGCQLATAAASGAAPGAPAPGLNVPLGAMPEGPRDTEGTPPKAKVAGDTGEGEKEACMGLEAGLGVDTGCACGDLRCVMVTLWLRRWRCLRDETGVEGSLGMGEAKGVFD